MRSSRIFLVATATGLFAIASSCRDIVAPLPVAAVTLSDYSVELVPQETEQITAIPKGETGTALNRQVSWSTSAPAVATVDNGLITAHGFGDAVVTAISEGVKAEASVVVSDGGVVTPSGSLITGLAGQVVLEVPSAAVSSPSHIIISPASATLSSPRLIPGSAVSLRTRAPLSQSALLAIRYDPQRILGSLESGLRLYEAFSTSWQPVAGSFVDLTTKTVRGRIARGGVYGIFAQAAVAKVSVISSAPGLKIGDSISFTAKAEDDNGAQLDGRIVAWASSAPSVLQIDPLTGAAVAKSPGSAVVTALIESKSGSTTVAVAAGPAKYITILAGNGQTADTSAELAIPPSVRVTDQSGFPVPGAPVSFTVTTGGGSISPATVATDAAGTASASRWVLGPAAGSNSITVTLADGASVAFVATATQPPLKLTPVSMSIVAGDGQSAAVLTAVPIRPAVRVVDAAGKPVPGVIVSFSIRSGGGKLTGEAATTDSAGIASAGSWTLGDAGGNSLFATRAGLAGSPLIFVATATTTQPPTNPGTPPTPPAQPSGPPVAMAIYSGDGQTAFAGSSVWLAPAVKVTDAAGIPVTGVVVTFSIRSGGGSISGEIATTNALGIATLGRWTLGDAGGNSLFATRAGLNGSPLIFAATATATASVRIVTFGDSNTDVGWSGTNSVAVATSYVSTEGPRAGPYAHNPTQLAWKIESKWRAVSAVSVAAVNHGVSGTSTGAGRTTSAAPNTREVVGGITRFAGEVLGAGYPWDGGESGIYFPTGSLKRVAAFVPGINDFVYVSMGTNDSNAGLSSQSTAVNINWMIDQWVGAGRQIDHFILTTLAPRPDTNGAIVLVNQQIRQIAASRGIFLVDLASRTSDDNGGTWRSAADHIGDQLHYSEPVRDWIATQVVAYMLAKAPR